MTPSLGRFRKKGIVEARRYEVGEDLSKISVQPDYTPQEGDMILHDPNNPTDQWLCTGAYFTTNYEQV